MKFGGTSVSSPERILRISEIISGINDPVCIVVVSAFSGITNQLQESLNFALKGESFMPLFEAIEQKHLELIDELIPMDSRVEIKGQIKLMLNLLEERLSAISTLEECSDKLTAKILGVGEMLSSRIISAAFNCKGLKNERIDSQELIKTEAGYLSGKVRMSETYSRIQKEFAGNQGVYILPGYIASNKENEPTLLGRGGSDYTAALLAGALEADRLEIWTDVCGVMTANPKEVKEAFTIPQLSYEEAMELSHFGAKVIYPPTIHPLVEKSIPLVIKNTFAPECEGTIVGGESRENGSPVKGISNLENIALLTLSGGGMVGIPGTSRRFFRILAINNINVLFISQSSSEHTICIAVPEVVSEKAARVVEHEFSYEIKNHQLDKPIVESNCSILALVGDNMRHRVGLAGKAFSSLGENGINIRAIAQGSSERNISIVIPKSDAHKAINVLHEAFFLSGKKRINLYFIGVGNVGGELIEQIRTQREYLSNELAIDLQVVGLSNSRQMIFDVEGINLDNWKEALSKSKQKMMLDEFINKVHQMNLRNSVIVDNTASAEVAAIYSKFLEHSVAVVASNKIAASSDYNNYKGLLDLARMKNTWFHYETNVAAGLPVIHTILDLVSSGDRINKLQAVLSGSLNFILNTISKEVSFSQAIEQAMEQGFTEPDPTIDLSGIDVKRKILILARECGAKINIEDVKLSPMVPNLPPMTSTVDAWLEELRKLDPVMEEKRRQAEKQNSRLRYVASYQKEGCAVALEAFPEDHPFYQLGGTDNIVLLSTQRYSTQPMVIKGAGAGAGVTAAGVFADILRVANNS